MAKKPSPVVSDQPQQQVQPPEPKAPVVSIPPGYVIENPQDALDAIRDGQAMFLAASFLNPGLPGNRQKVHAARKQLRVWAQSLIMEAMEKLG